MIQDDLLDDSLDEVESTPSEDLGHVESGELLQHFGPTWWLWDDEEFDILPEVGDSLDEMYDRLMIRPNIINQADERIFEARYELPRFEGKLKYAEALFTENAIGFLDFVIGVPYGCIERIGVAVEDGEDVIGVLDDGYAVPPVLEDLFQEKEGVASIFNLIWLDYVNTKSFAKALEVSPVLKNHWWFRINLIGDEDTHPVPGEFMSLVLFLFPNESWGWQRSDPSLFSGNWMETLFYTSGIVLEVLEDGAYIVQYRKNRIQAVSSDWAEYAEGDRVTILKEVDNPAESFTWEDMKDDDGNMKDYKEDKWVLAPITFYEEN